MLSMERVLSKTGSHSATLSSQMILMVLNIKYSCEANYLLILYRKTIIQDPNEDFPTWTSLIFWINVQKGVLYIVGCSIASLASTF